MAEGTFGNPQIVEEEVDILIIGGGMAACGAAYEIGQWTEAAKAKGHNIKVKLVDKAAMDRSGAVAMGLSAINTYVGENDPADYVRYVRNDLMGITSEDLVYDVGRHVDDSVHHFEERVFIVRLVNDKNDPNRVAGAAGFSVRENTLYVYKFKACLLVCGGAVNVFRPRSIGEGGGRAWYPAWNAGSTYAMAAECGAELTMMENRFVPARFKDGYGPVGAWFLLFKAKVMNGMGEDYNATHGHI